MKEMIDKYHYTKFCMAKIYIIQNHKTNWENIFVIQITEKRLKALRYQEILEIKHKRPAI